MDTLEKYRFLIPKSWIRLLEKREEEGEREAASLQPKIAIFKR